MNFLLIGLCSVPALLSIGFTIKTVRETKTMVKIYKFTETIMSVTEFAEQMPKTMSSEDRLAALDRYMEFYRSVLYAKTMDDASSAKNAFDTYIKSILTEQ